MKWTRIMERKKEYAGPAPRKLWSQGYFTNTEMVQILEANPLRVRG